MLAPSEPIEVSEFTSSYSSPPASSTVSSKVGRLYFLTHHSDVAVPLLHLDGVVLVAAPHCCVDLGELSVHQNLEVCHSKVDIGALQGHLDSPPNHLDRIQLWMGDG